MRSDNLTDAGPLAPTVPGWVFRQDVPPPDPLRAPETDGHVVIADDARGRAYHDGWRAGWEAHEWASGLDAPRRVPGAWLGAVLLALALTAGFWAGWLLRGAS